MLDAHTAATTPTGNTSLQVPSLPITPSITRRLAAWLYEGMLLFGVIFVAGYLFSTLSQTRHALDNRLLLQVFIFLILGVYFTWFWSKGQTLAMKTWNIRICDRHGAPLSQSRAMLRYCFSWIWFMPMLISGWLTNSISWGQILVIQCGWVLIWAILARFHPSKQFWHDALSGSRLIHFAHAKTRNVS